MLLIELVCQHPSSVNFRTKVADFGANHLVYYTIMQSRKVRAQFLSVRILRLIDCSQLYAWETSPIDDIALFLLCGEVLDVKVGVTATGAEYCA